LNKQMNSNRVPLLLWGLAVALLAYTFLDFWSQRNAPLFKRLERSWHQDVQLMQTSPQYEKLWADVNQVEMIGGTPETKALLHRTPSPIQTNPKGQIKLEVLAVLWEENGKRGILFQYDFVSLSNQNTVAEINRTYILSEPRKCLGVTNFLCYLVP